MRVSISPGSTVSTRTPVPASSAAQTRPSCSSAAFDAPYAPQRSYASVAASEVTLTIVPPPRSTIGPASAFVRRNGPTRFTASARSRSSQSVSSSSRSGTGPSVLALLTRTSIGPTAAAAWPAIACVASRSATSATIACASPPAARIAATAAASSSAWRATSTTRAPARASASPSARPSPRLPPVTSTFCPAIGRLMLRPPLGPEQKTPGRTVYRPD